MAASAIRWGARKVSHNRCVPIFHSFALEAPLCCCSSSAPLQCSSPKCLGFSSYRCSGSHARFLGAAIRSSSDSSLLLVVRFSNEAFLVEEPVRWHAPTIADSSEVAVFWDLNDCAVPDEIDPFRVGPNIVSALKMSGFNGPISIHAYGNTRRFNEDNLVQALIATGIDLHHVPGGEMDSNNRLLVDLLLWVKKNPPPAHTFLISGGTNFSSVLHKLQMKGYNVLWAYPRGGLSPALANAASKVWSWDGIMTGVSLVARSWKNGTPVNDDNISKTLQGHVRPQSHHIQDFQLEVGNEAEFCSVETKPKLRPIPNEVVEQVLEIVRSKPNGLTLGALRRQISKSNFLFDKGLYGHRDPLSFLLSIPRLNANIVWTSDRTRTYLFTVDDTKMADMPAVKELASPPAEHFKSKDGKDLGLSVCGSVKKGAGGDVIEDRIHVEADLDFLRQGSVSNEKFVDQSSPDVPSTVCVKDQLAANKDDAEKSVAMSSADRGVTSAIWKRAFSKLNILGWLLKFMGFKNPSTNCKLQQEVHNFESLDCNGENKSIEERKLIGKSKDIGKPISCMIAEKPLEEGWQTWPRRKKIGQKESGLALSNSKQVASRGPKIKSESFAKMLLVEVDFLVRCIEGRSMIPRTTTIKDLVKHLKESNLRKVAHFQEEQIFQLAKSLIQEKQLLRLHAKSAESVAQQQLELADEGGTSQSVTAADTDSEVVLEKQDETCATVRSKTEVSSTGSPSRDSEAAGATNFCTDSMVVPVPSPDMEMPSNLQGNEEVSSFDHREDWVEKVTSTDSTNCTTDLEVASIFSCDLDLNIVTPFEHFKDWVERVFANVRSVSLKTLLDKFQEDFNVVLDHDKYGFSCVHDLINETEIAQSFTFNNGLAFILVKGRKYSNQEIGGNLQCPPPVEDLKELLQDVLPCCEHGFPLSSIKELFKQRYGYALHNKALGHKTLASLVCSLDHVAVCKNNTGGLVMPKFSVPMGNDSDICDAGDEKEDEETNIC